MEVKDFKYLYTTYIILEHPVTSWEINFVAHGSEIEPVSVVGL